MDARHLFQLGTTDLGSGAAQTEGMLGWDVEVDKDHSRRDTKTAEQQLKSPAVPAGTEDLSGNTDEDHFIRRDGKVFAGTHLIIEVVDADGLNDAERIEAAFRECVDQCGATLLHIHLHRFSPRA